jgi:hypothetical protein
MTHADATRLDREPAPPPELRDRIITRLQTERATDRRISRRRIRNTVAAIAAALLVALGASVALRENGGSQRVAFASALPDTHGFFALHRNSTGTSITFTQEGLHPEDVYWLWLTDGSGKRVTAGTFRGSTNAATITMQAALPIDRVVRVWVTDQADAVVLDKVL